MKKSPKIDLQIELLAENAGTLSEQEIDEILNDLAAILICHWEKTHPKVPKDEAADRCPS